MPENQANNLNEFGASSFVIKSSEGVYIHLDKLESSDQFALFADRVFSSDYYFSNLDYASFLRLLGDFTPEMMAVKKLGSLNKTGKIRLAADILVFPPDRIRLYKAPRISSGKAEYLFETVMVEQITEEPLYAQNEKGELEVVGTQEKSTYVKDALVFDEFVAAMWIQGVRFGLDADVVKGMIEAGKTGRITIARSLPPKNGTDAELKEETDRLHRDNAPRELSNGKIDLKQFRNRFPQVRLGERLLKKSPRILGIPGMDIQGRAIEAPMPQDFDLASLAGEGTRIETTDEGECIVSAIDGFLNIDTVTNRIAVMEKIVNYTGVSIRTTGDIALDGENFEEHGEVQENRVVEGKNITFMADVFGKVVSTGGTILLKRNLVGGSATNHDGDIIVEGLASNAQLFSKYGTITIKRGENAIIIGKKVVAESLVNCTVVAESAELESSEGCAVTAKAISVTTAYPRKENQTILSILVPDFSIYKERITAIGNRIGEINLEIEAKRQESKDFMQQPELRNYLLISGKAQRKEIVLTDEQKANLQKLGARIAPSLKVVSANNAKIKALEEEQKTLEEELNAVTVTKSEAENGISCEIKMGSKETLVWRRQGDPEALFDTPPKDLIVLLRRPGRMEDRIKLKDGKISWTYGSE